MRRRASPGCSTLPADLLARFLGERLGGPVAIEGLKRFHGGAARETYRFDAVTADGKRRGLVLRRDPASSLIETERSVEYRALQAFHGTDVPVPEPLYIDAAAFGSPAFIMSEIPGVHAASIFAPDAYGAQSATVGERMFTILGRINARDPADLGLEMPAEPWRERLDHWRKTLVTDARGPEPVAWAAVRWLEANPPPPPRRASVVHGDYRSGNFLIDDANFIRAIVDWEMVHAGDGHEDLAWAMDPLWAHGSDRPASTCTEAEAIAYWQAASGITVDPEALRWWRVFAQFLGLAIWISSGAEVAAGRSVDPVMIFSSLYPYRYHNASLARTLRSLA